MKSKILVILTDDYEIFGNGTGDVEHCLIKPTEQLLELCGNHKIPVTLFADVAEYWAFEEEEKKGNFPDNCLPATKIRDQLIRTIQTGHDVQLHLHPQWLNYDYSPQSGWQVDLSMWRLPSLTYGSCENRSSILGALHQAKKTLEDMLKPFNSDYQCIAFRAGAWSIQPESQILEALKEISIKIESTVVPGHFYSNGLTEFDFREGMSTFRENAYWYISEDILRPSINDDKRLIEIPIFSAPYFIYERQVNKIKRKRLRLQNTPPSCTGTIFAEPSQNKRAKKSNLISQYMHKIKRQEMVDFTVSSADEMLHATQKAMKMFKNKYETIPVVFIGHSKVLSKENLSELDRFILKAKKKGVYFGTYHEILSEEV